MTGLLAQVGFVARRSIRTNLRQPAVVIPTITFPLLLLGLTSGGLSSATQIRGFPADSYLDFGLAVCFMQGALFAATTAGTSLARDIETGFLNRLQLTPLRRGAILLGQVAGAMAIAAIGCVCYLVVGLLFGASIKSGAGGVVVLLALAMLTALGFAGIGALMAARTGSAEAVQGLFPLIFVLFFLSSLNLPRRLIPTEWFATVATYNPVSYLVEGLRSLIIGGWDGPALIKGFVTAALISALALTAAGAALKTRIGRT